ncbi:hypothetical protein LXL04_001060 [Taraxacum kok-saghyz]
MDVVCMQLKDSKVPLGCAFSLDKHSYHRLKNLSSDIAKNRTGYYPAPEPAPTPATAPTAWLGSSFSFIFGSGSPPVRSGSDRFGTPAHP